MFNDNVSIIWLISSLKTMPGDIISVPKMKARGNSVILLCLFLYFLSYSLLWFPADNICLMANLKLQAKLWKPTREALCLWTRLERETMTKNGCLSWNSKTCLSPQEWFALCSDRWWQAPWGASHPTSWL